MSGSIAIEGPAVAWSFFQEKGFNLRPGDAVFASRDGKKWHRVHVITRREARKRVLKFPPRVARYWKLRIYGRSK